MPLIHHLLKIAIILGGISIVGPTPPVAAEDGLGDQLQPLVLRYCKLVPGNWRRTVAVLSLMPPERLQRVPLPFEDVGMTQQCAETVRDMMCSAEYVNELEGLLKEVYKIPDLDKKMLTCGAVGGVIGLALDGSVDGAMKRGGQAMGLCGIYYTIKSIGGCEKRKADLSRLVGQIQWPERIESPARFELQALQKIDQSGLEMEQKALIYAEIETRYKTLRNLPNTMGDR
ncbi:MULTISPECIES: hypothetical protein [Rhizobium]|uniref:C_GCAxxG_C_C family protein n=1 Tax=Rhizobium aouanii TaxID=3118145 RepID=A0ABU8CUN6_9HYPH|nr:hypothetical protein [Rhizobium acaciae]MCW1754156.1 hypothetical protein [Rhizobium acaciae]